ncbi:MAG: hypothetical protein M3015_12615, partial [Bacteroidota bacterium]|nr:hypothetical protein [Bacteroidota bacterium]
INAFLQTKHLDVAIDENKEFKLSKMKSITNYPSSLTYIDNDNIQRFIIFNKEVWDSANVHLNAAKNSL